MVDADVEPDEKCLICHQSGDHPDDLNGHWLICESCGNWVHTTCFMKQNDLEEDVSLRVAVKLLSIEALKYTCKQCMVSPRSKSEFSDNSRKILAFSGKNHVFSNFYETEKPMKCDRYPNIEFKSNEHFFAYSKAKALGDEQSYSDVLNAPTGSIAYRIHHALPNPPNWDSLRQDILTEGVRLKSIASSRFRQALVSSGDILIYEALPKSGVDYFYSSGLDLENTKNGRGHFPGFNFMGKTLMNRRKQL